MLSGEREMVRPPDVAGAPDPDRSTSLQPTYEDTIQPDPLFDWNLEDENDDGRITKHSTEQGPFNMFSKQRTKSLRAVFSGALLGSSLFFGAALCGQQPNPPAGATRERTQPPAPSPPPSAPRPVPKGQFPTEPITRTLLQRTDAPGLPGYETRLYLVEYGPNVKAPIHHHPVAGVGYVVSGAILSGFSGRYPNRYETGQSFIELAGEPHTISQNISASEPVRMIIAYTVKGDDPVTLTP